MSVESYAMVINNRRDSLIPRTIKLARILQIIMGSFLILVSPLFIPLSEHQGISLEAAGAGYALVGILLIVLAIYVGKGSQSSMLVSILTIFFLFASLILFFKLFRIIMIELAILMGLFGLIVVPFFAIAISLFSVTCLIIFYWRLKKTRWKITKEKLAKAVLPLLIIAIFAAVINTYLTSRKNHWFDSKIAEWQAPKYRNMEFGGNTPVFLGYSFTQEEKSLEGSFDFETALMQAIKETGADIVRVGISDDAFRSNNSEEIVLDDKFIAQIKEGGKKVFLADTQHSPYLLRHPVTWNKFKRLHLKRIEMFTQRYKPEYYQVVTEPTTYHSFGVKDEINVDEWVKHTRELVNSVKKLSPQTKTFVTIQPGESKEIKYYEKVLKIQNLDAIGVEIYSPAIFEEVKKLLLIGHPHYYGKELWISETWNGYALAPPRSETNDAKWLWIVFYFAQRYKFDGIIPWPFGAFITYRAYLFDSADTKIDFSSRTPAFYAYKEIIKEARNNEGF